MNNEEMQRKIEDLEREMRTLKEILERSKIQQINFPLDTASVNTIGQALRDNNYSL